MAMSTQALAGEWSPESGIGAFEGEGYGEAAWESAGFEGEAWEDSPEAGAYESAYESAYEGAYEGEGVAWEGEAWEDSPELSGFEGEGANYEAAYEREGSDQFLPFLLPLAAKALPAIAKLAGPALKSLLPMAKKAIPNVVRGLLRPGQRRVIRRRVVRRGMAPMVRPVGGAMPAMPGVAPATVSPSSAAAGPVFRSRRWRRRTVAGLLRQLAAVLGEGEAAASQLEASFFGPNAAEGELAGNEQAHEAALTEVLAAEASHAGSEREAQALLGSALPITIRIVAGRGRLRPLVPALVGSNQRLVASLRRSGPGGRQLLRLVPAIQRRTIASLRAAQRSGRRVPPWMVAPVMTAHAARVLGVPRIAGPVLMRNTAIRRATVRTRQPYGTGGYTPRAPAGSSY